MGFSRQEYWSGLPFPSPGDLLDPGIKSVSLTSPSLTGGFFTTSATETLLRIFNNIAGHQLKSNIYKAHHEHRLWKKLDLKMNITETMIPAQKELPLGMGLRRILLQLIQPVPRGSLGQRVGDREVSGGVVNLNFERELSLLSLYSILCPWKLTVEWVIVKQIPFSP